jgi:hypothetical protein
MENDGEAFIELLSIAKEKEKILTEFIITLYTNIKNKNPVKLKHLVFDIQELGKVIPESDLNKYLKLYEMKYEK